MTLSPENPFAQRSTLEFELPPFEQIRNEHYLPAAYAGFEAQLAEVEEILAQTEITFENTIVAMERSGQLLMRALIPFYNKSSSDTDDELDKMEEELAPKLSAHSDFDSAEPGVVRKN